MIFFFFSSLGSWCSLERVWETWEAVQVRKQSCFYSRTKSKRSYRCSGLNTVNAETRNISKRPWNTQGRRDNGPELKNTREGWCRDPMWVSVLQEVCINVGKSGKLATNTPLELTNLTWGRTKLPPQDVFFKTRPQPLFDQYFSWRQIRSRPTQITGLEDVDCAALTLHILCISFGLRADLNPKIFLRSWKAENQTHIRRLSGVELVHVS